MRFETVFLLSRGGLNAVGGAPVTEAMYESLKKMSDDEKDIQVSVVVKRDDKGTSKQLKYIHGVLLPLLQSGYLTAGYDVPTVKLASDQFKRDIGFRDDEGDLLSLSKANTQERIYFIRRAVDVLENFFNIKLDYNESEGESI